MQVGDESYESYTAEKDGILSSLARRAKVSSKIYIEENNSKCRTGSMKSYLLIAQVVSFNQEVYIAVISMQLVQV